MSLNYFFQFLRGLFSTKTQIVDSPSQNNEVKSSISLTHPKSASDLLATLKSNLSPIEKKNSLLSYFDYINHKDRTFPKLKNTDTLLKAFLETFCDDHEFLSVFIDLDVIKFILSIARNAKEANGSPVYIRDEEYVFQTILRLNKEPEKKLCLITEFLKRNSFSINISFYFLAFILSLYPPFKAENKMKTRTINLIITCFEKYFDSMKTYSIFQSKLSSNYQGFLLLIISLWTFFGFMKSI